MISRPTRRGILALAPAAALAPASAAGTAPHPDAELLAACARFRALTAQNDGFFATIPDEDERDAAIDAMHDDWEDALDAMCAAPPAVTLVGALARAVALAEYMPDWLTDRTDYWDERQRGPLMRDLVALAEAIGLEPRAKPNTG